MSGARQRFRIIGYSFFTGHGRRGSGPPHEQAGVGVASGVQAGCPDGPPGGLQGGALSGTEAACHTPPGGFPDSGYHC